MNNKITAITIIYNEEKLIDRCLKGVYGIVDEIMVFHDGPCSDKSLEIAKKYTDKIYELDRRGNIEAHLSDVLRKINTEWVLVLDADEYPSFELRKNIKELVNDERYDAFSFLEPVFNPDIDEYIYDVKSRYKTALLRVSKAHFIGIMHHGCETYGKLKLTKYILEHRPLVFNFTFKSFNSKFLKLARFHAESYFKNWSDVPRFNYTGADPRLSGGDRFKFKHPLLSIPLTFLINFFRLIFQGKLYKVFTYKYATLVSLYSASVCYYIYKFKKQKI